MSKKGASMKEGVGLQCQRVEVNVKERSKVKGLGFKARRNEGAWCKVNKHARVQTKEQAERSRLGFKARRKVAERYRFKRRSNCKQFGFFILRITTVFFF